MRTRSLSFNIAQPYASLLEQEAEASGRSVEDHFLHILSRRYDNLIRICSCGYFIYLDSDNMRCAECGRECCINCSTPFSHRDVCEACQPKDSSLRSFRASTVAD
jgi:hypothetical protein